MVLGPPSRPPSESRDMEPKIPAAQPTARGYPAPEPEGVVRPLPVLSYDQVLDLTAQKRRHILLGNGFSRAAHSRFSYASLYEVAIALTPSIECVFQRMGTTNFEVALRGAADAAEAHRVRSALIKAVAKVHPYHAPAISTEEYASCAAFLEDFVGVRRGDRRGLVFTTNYDLLLYWTLVHHNKELRCYDGFDHDGVWSPFAPAQVFYLHGGLHLFEHQLTAKCTQTIKLLWEPDAPLIKQIRHRLDQPNDFPIFVSEGSAGEKMASLRGYDYLRNARRRFNKKVCKDVDGVLITVGQGLSTEDEHITTLVGSGEIGTIIIGTHCPADRERAAHLASVWAAQRAFNWLPAPEVYVFDSSECSIWSAKAAGPEARPNL
jgi:hypothetical protein